MTANVLIINKLMSYLSFVIFAFTLYLCCESVFSKKGR